MSGKKNYKLGESIKAKEIVRPDGRTLKVTGGQIYLDETGPWRVDGNEIEVKKS